MANARPSLLLNGRAGWRAAESGATLDVTPDAIVLRPLPGSARPLADVPGATSMAVDRSGRIHLLDSAACTIRRFDPCTAQFETLSCIGGEGSEPRRFRAPHGIAISCAGDLFVADTGNRRVQVFLLAGLALREIRDVGDGEPWDVAVTSDCRLFVSDRAHGVVHQFDRAGHRLAILDGFEKPTAIAVDRQDNVYVVEEGKPAVIVIRKDGSRRAMTRLDRGSGAFLPPGIEGLEFDAANNPIVAAGGRLSLLDGPQGYETEGTFISEPLDSRIYGCEWHRVVLRGAIAPGTQVHVETFTSEAPKSPEEVRALPGSRWMTRADYVRVGEDAWDCLILSPPGRYCWLRVTLTGSGQATPRIEGIRIHFPRASSLQYLPPVYAEEPFSRDFLARFLSIFDTIRDGIGDRVGNAASLFDPEAAPAKPNVRGGSDFLTWLGTWIGLAVERNWPVEKRRRLVREAHRLYELRGTMEGLRLHIRLLADREPRILEHFRLRQWMFLDSGRLGDCSALFGSSIVRRLQLDRFSRIGEFQLVDSGDPLRDPFHAYAHRFSVMVPLPAGADEESERRTLERVIELAKPAHTVAELHLVQPQMRIGVQSYLGVDTVVGEYPAETITEHGRLGYDTVLSHSIDEADPPAMRVGTRTRIGVSTTVR